MSLISIQAKLRDAWLPAYVSVDRHVDRPLIWKVGDQLKVEIDNIIAIPQHLISVQVWENMGDHRDSRGGDI